MPPYRPSSRWLVALLSATLIIQAGATAPAFVLAEESAAVPTAPESAPPDPELNLPPSAPATPAATPSVEPTPTPAPPPTTGPSPTASPPPVDPGEPPGTERVDLRTADSRTFEQSDGSFVTEFFSGSIFYQPEGETAWQPIDINLEAEAGTGKPTVDEAPTRLSLSAADSAEGFVTLAGDGMTISFGLPAGTLPGRANAQPVIMKDGLYAEYADFLPGGIGLRVFPRADGFKSFLVLPSQPLINSFTFAVDAPSLTLSDEGDGTLAFRDKEGKVVAIVPRPYMVDSSVVEGRGGGLYSEAVTMSLTVAGALSLITLTVDPVALDSAVYPVYVDPTTTNFPTGSTTTSDTFAAQRYPGSNFSQYQDPGGYYEMWHGKEPGYTTYDEVFIRFNDLMETLPGVHIDSASLQIYPWWQYSHYDWKPTWVERVAATWASNTLTWNNRPATNLSLGQFDTKEGVWSDGTGTWLNGGVEGYVQDVVNGIVPNNGLKLHAASIANGGWKRFVSSNNSTLKPKLVVSWHRPSATPAAPIAGAPSSGSLSWTYDAGEPAPAGTPQSHYWVQVGTTSAFTTILRETTDGGTGKWAPGASTSWTFPSTGTPLTEGTTYYWRVKVKDGFGESNWSAAASFVYVSEARRGEEAYYTRVPFDLGGGWRMAVGVHNGELTLDRYLFEIPSYGPPQTLSLSYSAQNTASAYLGTGWSSNLTQRLTFATGIVNWHRSDGGVVPFFLVGSTWTPLAGHFETLTAGAGEYTVTMKDQSKLVFEGTGAGRLKRIDNRFGKSLTLSWGTNSATATDASGRVTNIVISGGLITSVTDSAGRQWAFGYTAGQLTTVTDPASKTTTLAYGASGLTTVTRLRSRVSGGPETITWSVAYVSGKVSGVTDPVNASVANTFTYNGSQTTVGLLKQYSPVVRNTWTYTFDGLGRVTSTLDPAGYTTGYVYDASSNLIELTLPIDTSPAVNQTISYTYDARGNVLTQTTQLTPTTSVVTAMSYNATNDQLTRSEADNDSALKLVTRHVYDGSGHLTSTNVNCTSSGTTPPTPASSCTGAGTQNAATNLITAYTYTANDQLAGEADPLGRVTVHVYDTHGNGTHTVANFVSGQSATAERNVITAFTYDQQTTAGKAGLATSMTDPVGNVATYTYDALGRQTSEGLPGDSSIPALTRSMTYDELGNVLTETESWTGVTRTTTHVYDKANRETSLTDPANVVTTTSYDAAGNAISTTAAGVTTTWTFDGLGRALQQQVQAATTTYQYDGQGRETTTVDPEGVVTVRSYDIGGRIVSETVDLPPAQEPDLTTSYSYDLLGSQTSMTPPDAVATMTTYDRVGRVACERYASGQCPDPTGPEATYAYDRIGNQTSATDRGGTTTTTDYDPLNRPTRIIANYVQGTPGPGENVTSWTYYDAAGNVVATKDADGNVTRQFYSVRGTLTRSISNCTNTGIDPPADPATCAGTGMTNSVYNVVTTLAFDGSGSQQGIKDPRGTVTRTFYNAAGQPTKTIVNCTNDTTNPSPPSADWWNCNGSTLNDGTWNVTTLRSYYPDGTLEKETAPNGGVTKYVYDGSGSLAELIDNWVAGTPAAHENISTYFAYDDAGRQTAVRAPTTNRSTFSVTRFLYDDAGRLVTEIRNCTDSGTTPPGDPAWKTCQGLGTPDADTNLVTQYSYDASGNQGSVTTADPSATTDTSQATVTTRYAYDNQNRLCGVLENAMVPLASPDPCVSPGSGTATTNVWTRYTYDAVGNLTSMVDGRGNTTSYGYDEFGRLTTVTDALSKTTTYGYDDLGRRTSKSERGTGTMPTLVSWTYDDAGRVATRTWNDGTAHTTTYEYDANGNRTRAFNQDGQTVSSDITATYDRLNRPLSVSVIGDSGATTSYTYSLTSPSWTDPSGTYSATLDKYGRQVTLTDPIHGASQFIWTYRADGQPATAAAPNGNTTTFGYDDAGTVLTKVTAAGQNQRANYTWTRNRAGQVLTEASTITSDPTNGTTTYAYDPLARLTSYTRASSTTTYGWQAVPNRSSIQVGASPAVTTTFNNANRPTSDSAGGSYTSDDEGRLKTRPGQILDWDDLGRLVAVRDSSTGAYIAIYAYDALDRLFVAWQAGGDYVAFRYVGLTTQVAQIVDVYTGALRSVANDWSGVRMVDWTGSGSDQHFFGTNGHHDTTWMADSAGAVVSTLRFDAWGDLASSTGSYLPAFRFQGSWFDALTNMYWVRARWYVPTLGRFVSEDAATGRQDIPASRHPYAYGGGNPVSRWDPTGYYWVKVQAGEDTHALAKRYLYSERFWPRVLNRNRWLYGTKDRWVALGYCAWIEPFTTRPANISQCPSSGIKLAITGQPDDWADLAIKTLRVKSPWLPSWLQLTSDAMKRITNERVGRAPRPNFEQSVAYKVNQTAWDEIAKTLIGGQMVVVGGLQLYDCFPTIRGTNRVNGQTYVKGSCLFPPRFSLALTIGHYVFLDRSLSVQPPTWIDAHEYIHTLQYQANAGQFVKYIVDIVNGVDTRAGYPLEAIGYLWGSWIKAYERWEQEPWQIWLPM